MSRKPKVEKQIADLMLWGAVQDEAAKIAQPLAEKKAQILAEQMAIEKFEQIKKEKEEAYATRLVTLTHSIESGRGKIHEAMPAARRIRQASLAQHVRALTNGNRDQAEFFHMLANDKKQPMNLRLEAHKWLADRGTGKAVETLVGIAGEKENNPLSELSDADIEEILKK